MGLQLDPKTMKILYIFAFIFFTATCAADDFAEESLDEAETFDKDILDEVEAFDEDSLDDDEALDEDRIDEVEAFDEDSLDDDEALDEDRIEEFDEVEAFDEDSLDEDEAFDEDRIEEFDPFDNLTRSDDPKAYGDAVDTLCGRFTTKRVEGKRNTIGTFTVQKQTRRCVAYYELKGGCREMKLTCSTFFVDNRDPGRCKNGDRFLVKVPNTKKPMRYCKNDKPTDRFPVLSTSKMKIWFHAHEHKRFKSKAVSCQVECSKTK